MTLLTVLPKLPSFAPATDALITSAERKLQSVPIGWIGPVSPAGLTLHFLLVTSSTPSGCHTAPSVLAPLSPSSAYAWLSSLYHSVCLHTYPYTPPGCSSVTSLHCHCLHSSSLPDGPHSTIAPMSSLPPLHHPWLPLLHYPPCLHPPCPGRVTACSPAACSLRV